MIGPLRLFAAHPKTPGSYDRTVALDRTLAAVPDLQRRFGITRIADLTLLDRTGIPAINAVVPDSPDAISTYTGKGPTRDHALAGAVMEAIERQIAAAPRLETIVLRPCDVRDGIDGTEIGLRPAYFTQPLPFVRGWDLLRDEPALVPLAAVQCPNPGLRAFPWSTTNGLASGNTLVEAIYHALTELIERHRWSIAEARGHLRPRAIVESFTGASGVAAGFVDDPAGAFVTLPTGVTAVDALLEAIDAAGLESRLLALDDGPLPPVLLATVTDPPADPPMVHLGLGCSWSPEHAAVRALTEAVQSRLVDIQSAREDIQPASGPEIGFGDHGRRLTALPRGRWFYDAPAPFIPFASLPDRADPDLGRDLEALIDAFRASGIERAVIVDLTPPDAGIAVVRAIVPGLESYVVDGRIGRTIRAILGRHAGPTDVPPVHITPPKETSAC